MYTKRAIKWINADYSNSHTFNNLLYYTHWKQLDILPIRYRFDYHDIKLFHQSVHNIFCIKLPSYLHLFEGRSRLRFTHLDRPPLITDVVPASRVYNFYRTHIQWNQLPYSCLRAIIKPGEFKPKLIKYIWQNLVDCDDDFEGWTWCKLNYYELLQLHVFSLLVKLPDPAHTNTWVNMYTFNYNILFNMQYLKLIKAAFIIWFCMTLTA